MFKSRKAKHHHVPEPAPGPDATIPSVVKPQDASLHGMGTMLTGAGSAWTKSFNVKGAECVKTLKRVESEGLLEVDDDLLNPAVDDQAWNAKWYAPNISANAAAAALGDKADGCFLIRDQSNTSNAFTLIYSFSGKTHSTAIQNEGAKKGIRLPGSEEFFPTLSDFVAFYSDSDNGDLPCNLDSWTTVAVEETEVEKETPSKGAYAYHSNVKWQKGQVKLLDAKTGAKVSATQRRPHGSADMKARAGKDASKADALAGVKPILKTPASIPNNNSRSVTFDEASIYDTRAALMEVRGVWGRVDDEAKAYGYYVGCATKDKVHTKLKGGEDGSFLVYDKDAETFHMSYIKDSKIVDTTLINTVHGIKLDGSEKLFKNLTDLVDVYSEDNMEWPYMLTLPDWEDNEEDESEVSSYARPDSVTKVALATPEEVHEHTDAASDAPTAASSDVGDSVAGSSADAAPPASPAVEANSKYEHLNEQWYQGQISRAEAANLIEFEPSGTFVVRDNPDEKDAMCLDYVKNGKLLRAVLEPRDGGYAVGSSDKVEPSIMALVTLLASEDWEKEKQLEVRLRLRKPRPAGSALPAKAPSPSKSPSVKRRKKAAGSGGGGGDDGASGHGWMRLGFPKVQALHGIADKQDGAFVIRSSESRPECHVLSYKFRGQIYHELIQVQPGVGYTLECASSRTFTTLEELVRYFEQPQPGLKYPLMSTAMPPLHVKSNNSSRNASTRRRPKPNLKRQPSNVIVPPLKRSSSSHGGGGGGRPGMLKKQPSAKSLGGGGGGGGGRPGMLKKQPSAKSLGGRPGLKKQASSKKLSRQASKGGGLGKDPSNMAKLHRSQSRGDLGHTEDKHKRTQSRRGGKPPKLQRGNSSMVLHNDNRIDQRAAMSNWFCLNLNQEEALSRLPKGKEGAFVIRKSADHFATLSLSANKKIQHFHLEDTDHGLRFLKSKVFQPNLSAVVAYYKNPAQEDLPRPLIQW